MRSTDKGMPLTSGAENPSSAPTLSLEERVGQLEALLSRREGDAGIHFMTHLEIKEIARRYASGDKSALREWNRRQTRRAA